MFHDNVIEECPNGVAVSGSHYRPTNSLPTPAFLPFSANVLQWQNLPQFNKFNKMLLYSPSSKYQICHSYSPRSSDAPSRCSCRVSQLRGTRTWLHTGGPGCMKWWQKWRCSNAHRALLQLWPVPEMQGSISAAQSVQFMSEIAQFVRLHIIPTK